MRSGYCAIIGKPNVGKSTILNALVGEKISIVAERPETTRDNISGVLTLKDAQVVFVDTPGIHRPRNLLGRHMSRTAKNSVTGVDLALLIFDAKSGITREDEEILRFVKKEGIPVMLAINKIDTVKKASILPLISRASGSCEFLEIIPICAKDKKDVKLLLEKIIDHIPTGKMLFPADRLTDKTERFCAAELVRENALELTRHEVPHALAVVIEEFKYRKNTDLLYIRAEIYVEKPSQKKILIGRGGGMLKKIGQESRKDLQEIFGKKVFLDLWVKVYKDWRRDPRALRILGISRDGVSK
jgi:GTP-binding protein Era